MKKFTVFALSLVFIFTFTLSSFALELNVKAEENAYAGEKVKVAITYENEGLDYVKSEISYDTEKLKYVSGGTSEGDGGLVVCSYYSDDGEEIKINLVFEAKEKGETNIDIKTYECYDFDGNDLGTPSALKTVNIEEKAVEKEKDAEEDETAVIEEEENVEQRNTNSSFLFACVGITLFLIVIIAVLAASGKRRK